MSRTSPKLVIDARPQGAEGPLAGACVLGRPVIQHLFDVVERVDPSASSVAIHARQDEHDRLRRLMADRPSSRYRLALGPPPEDAVILRTDRFYDPARLRKAINRGRDPESAVVWRIDRPHALAVAADELTRRWSYQPLGRYWARRPALALARRLAPTAIRPNQVTLATGVLMLGGAGLVAFGRGTVAHQVLPALAFAVALVCDTADGHLARLQGTASEFGRWLDANLDELADMALHAAVAWSAFARTGHPGWLVLGTAYATAKYLFVVGAQPSVSPVHDPTTVAARPGWVRTLAHAAGHADLRWHLWILLAAVGQLPIALAAYTAYFAARTAGVAWRKAARHGA